MQSGMGTAPHFFMDKDTAKGLSTAFAEKLNCTFESKNELLKCLSTKDPETLVRIAEKMKVMGIKFPKIS